MAKVVNCLLEELTHTPITVEREISLYIFESLFKKCTSSRNGGAILAQNCKDINISKVCSHGCSCQGFGLFMYVQINKDLFNVNITHLSFSDAKSLGCYGVDIFSKSIGLVNSNFSNTIAYKYPAFSSDQTKYGICFSFSEIVNNTCSNEGSIFALEEVDSSGQNLMTYVNVLNNIDNDVKTGVIIINRNIKTKLFKCNIHGNTGKGYLIFSTDIFAIEQCSVQTNFVNKLCNQQISIISIPPIAFDVNAPRAGQCLPLKHVTFGTNPNIFNINRIVVYLITLIDKFLSLFYFSTSFHQIKLEMTFPCKLLKCSIVTQ